MDNYIEEGAIYELVVPYPPWNKEIPANATSKYIKYCKDEQERWNGVHVKVSYVRDASFGRSGKEVACQTRTSSTWYIDCTGKEALFEGVWGASGHSHVLPAHWFIKLIKHCPQVEHYIESQKQDTYVSPFTGKVM